MDEPQAGDSAMARSFGASVSLATPERGLYLVIGRGVSPLAAVNGVGGQIALQLPDGVRALAVLPVAAHPALQRHPDIALAGPVTIDPERFARFVAFTGLNGGR